MKMQNRLWGIVAIVFALLTIAGCDTSSVLETAPNQVEAEILFEKAVTLEEAFAVIHENEIQPVLISHTYMVGEQEWTGFIYVDGQASVNETREEIIQNVNRMVDQVKAGSEQTESTQEIGQFEETSVRVTRLAVRVPEREVDRLRKEYDLNLPDDAVPDEAELSKARSSLVAASKQSSSWAPSTGYVYSGQSGNPNTRFLLNGFSWNTSVWPNLYRPAYEHEFRLNNYPGGSLPNGTYLSRSTSDITYAASNLPGAYWDTRASDTGNEISYTIGSACGEQILANANYYTYLQVRNGDANVDNGKLWGQLGVRLYNVKSTYFIFTVEGDPIVPAWDVSLPGFISWTN